MRGCMREAGSRQLKRRVGRMLSPAFRAKDAATARAMCHVARDMLRDCCPKAAAVAEEAEPDALAYLGFPPSHWKRLRANNVQERANPPCVVSWMPLVSPSMFLPTFRLVRRAETNNARTFTGTGIVAARHKDRIKGC